MLKRKILILILVFCFCFTGCSLINRQNQKDNVLNDKKISVEAANLTFYTPKDFVCTHSSKTKITSNQGNLASLNLVFKNYQSNDVIILKKYDYSIENYLSDFNAFPSIAQAKYDNYMKKYKSNKNFEIVYLNSGVTIVDGKEINYDCFIFEYNNASYTMEFLVNEKSSLDVFSIFNSVCEYIREINEAPTNINEITGYDLYEIDNGLYITIPTYYTKHQYKSFAAENYYFFYTQNYESQIIVVVSPLDFIKNSKEDWVFVNGLEICSEGDYIHDININKYYRYKVSKIYKKDLNENNRYIQVIYLDNGDNADVFNFIDNTLNYMDQSEYQKHKLTLQEFVKK